MRNLGIRVILFFIAVPALVAIGILLPYANHLALNVIVVVMSALGASELATLFGRKDARYRASVVIIPMLGATVPLSVLIATVFDLSVVFPIHVTVAVLGVILFVQIFRHTADDFHHTLTNIAANFTVVIYPGLFLTYIILMSTLDWPTVLILTFLCSVFFNDTMAYIAGGVYRSIRQRRAQRSGREWAPRFVFPVSPKKTVVGFVAGFLLSPAVIVSANAIFPDAIPGGWITAVGIGCAVGAATIVGDLIESAIKRSATSKDSGGLIPGRGGVLDSVDSVLYAAPVFYYLVRYLT